MTKPTPPVPPDALATFTEWFCLNYPGPDTIIHRPEWHAPKVFRAAESAIARQRAMDEKQHAPPVPPDELVGKWKDEYTRIGFAARYPIGTCSKLIVHQAAAWGWEQAIPEREELAGLLERAWSAIDFHVDHNEPDFALRDELRAAAERMRPTKEDS
jgi:hypothetical protein